MLGTANARGALLLLFRSGLAVAGLGLSVVLIRVALRSGGDGARELLIDALTSKWVVAAVALEATVQAMRARRFQLMLAPVGAVRYLTSLLAVVGAAGATHLSPVRVDELTRSWVIARRDGLAPTTVLGVSATDKVVDLVAVAALIVAAVLTAPLPSWLAAASWTLAGVAGAAVLAWILLVRSGTEWLRTLPAPLVRIAEGVVVAGRARWPLLLPLVVLEWGATLLLYVLAGRVFGIEVGLSMAVGLAVAQAASYAVPHVPGGLGTYEASTILVLQGLGQASSDAALAYALWCHAVLGVPHMLTFLALVLTRAGTPRSRPDTGGPAPS